MLIVLKRQGPMALPLFPLESVNNTTLFMRFAFRKLYV